MFEFLWNSFYKCGETCSLKPKNELVNLIHTSNIITFYFVLNQNKEGHTKDRSYISFLVQGQTHGDGSKHIEFSWFKPFEAEMLPYSHHFHSLFLVSTHDLKPISLEKYNMELISKQMNVKCHLKKMLSVVVENKMYRVSHRGDLADKSLSYFYEHPNIYLDIPELI